MADIELVIKIPEELVSELDDDDYERVISWYETTLYCAIKEGTLLPKGHGRLIDENNLWFEDIDDVSCVTQRNVENAPTIIEADKSESEEGL